MNVLGGKSQPGLKNLKQFIKVGLLCCLRQRNILDFDSFQDSHIVQLLFKDASQQSAIVEEIETPKVQKNFFLFDSGMRKGSFVWK